MALRDVVIRSTMNEMVGDEEVEVWLKVGSDPWILYDTVDVEAGPTQDFEFIGVEEDVAHVMQLRAVRDSRYRAGYLGSDPDGWPEQSRVEFIPGTSAALAPTIVGGTWDEPTITATITVTPNPAHLADDLELLRDSVPIATIPGPHVGDVVFEDILGAGADNDHAYTARHVVGGLHGTLSDVYIQWEGALTLGVSNVEYDSAPGEENMKVYFEVRGDSPAYDTLKLWWRWSFGSVDYPGGGGGGIEHGGDVVVPLDSPKEYGGIEFGYSFPPGAGSTEHHMEFRLAAYASAVEVATSPWQDGFFVTPP